MEKIPVFGSQSDVFFVEVQGWVRDGFLHQLNLKLLNREPRTHK